ncbi:STAS domain-containing protein [Streptomyces sp. OfavH-34-F]|uniref:STAS domain-containing protein n=1 Tax=Streptomyces sp. OfavH-34-F TaxID=2917760 RepID=UPI001EF35EF3|nr:STAS domain-containing protein [Streptomyces sp. OfavH-34-F]MCG7523582.1 STAS domain-containing protein [Streptomyces sp. OfavH-34-F]
MNITTVINGTSARITPRGDIDADTLVPLRTAVHALPPHVTDLQWDLRGTFFMDVTGLHLFVPSSTPAGAARRRITVTGLQDQPARLLLLAADTRPDVIDFAGLLPDSPAEL